MRSLGPILQKIVKKQKPLDPGREAVDRRLVSRFGPLADVMRVYFRPEYRGMEHVPRSGPALLVGNHGLFGFDFVLVYSEIFRRTGRVPRSLAEHLLFVEPHLDRALRRFGIIDGSFENGLRFLKEGHLVCVMPGGAREALKGARDRYRLMWDQSRGFVRLAMRARAPVVLFMGMGIDDTYRILGKVRWTGRLLGHEKYELPIWMGWGPLPRPVKFSYRFSEPIYLDGEPDDADNDAIVAANHERLRCRGQSMLDEALRQRRSLWFG